MNPVAFRLFAIVLLAIGMAMFLCVEDASAANTGDATAKKADKSSATKKGMDALATKEFDQAKLPGKLEYAITVGSCIAMIAVVKYL